jgi:hypothetical protein
MNYSSLRLFGNFFLRGVLGVERKSSRMVRFSIFYCIFMTKLEKIGAHEATIEISYNRMIYARRLVKRLIFEETQL